MVYNMNNLLINITNTINNDSILFKYIIISFFGLLILNLNMFYFKTIQIQKTYLINILKLNILIFISTILLLYLYDLIFYTIDEDLIDKALKFKSGIEINLILIFKLMWLFSFLIIVLIALNVIKKTLQILFSSFFIGFNSYIINLWAITDIDDVLIDNFLIKWTKIINKELLYNKVINISKTLENNILSSIDIINWVNHNINYIYKMNNAEIHDSLVEQNNNKIQSNTIINWYDIITQTNNLILILSSIILVSSITILGYQCIQFIYNFDINGLFFPNRPGIDELVRHDINNINELSNVANNIIENNNIAYNSINTITNFMIGLYRVINDLSQGINNDINPRLTRAENRIDDLIKIIDRLVE